jgi:flagellar hook protein FlgE
LAFPDPTQGRWLSLPAVDIQSGFSNMVSTAYNAALSGLHAASVKLKVGANNLANANTDGYQKQQVTTQTGTYGVEVKVEKVSTVESPNIIQSGGELSPDAPSNVDVAEELLEMKVAQNLFEANLKTLNANDNMLGRILDIEA